MTSGVELPGSGSFVTEVGMRQAWLFLTLCDNTPETPVETRLFLDTSWSLDSDRFDLDADELESGLVALCRLVNRTLDHSAVLADGGLLLDFGDDGRLEIDGNGTAATTHDVWWLGRVGDVS
jgi:hypothetical protein